MAWYNLYNGARLLAFPSLNEGFGLPAVEAMACGTPVAASNTGALPEIIGDAGRFFDPVHPEQMVETIKGILSNEPLREEMRRYGLVRANGFSWEKTARETLAGFDGILNQYVI